jgi:preprotein translocase subunit SecA
MFKKVKIALGLDPIQKQLDAYTKVVEQINLLESAYEKLSDEELNKKSLEFRQRLTQGETLDDILPEAFAAVRESSKRVLGMRHYDVQLIGGMALHDGNIAEMRTGEGKTLVATLAVYLNALSEKGVHLITVNDYLARRDARWMAPIYQMLGLSVGVLQMAARTDNGKKAFLVDFSVSSPKEDQDHLRLVSRKEAYDADITYGTNSEFGFDYLRDNMTMNLEDRVQRGHHYAIIDEVDNVLIDEARTPLIISGPASDDVEEYYRMAKVVKQLLPEEYEVSEKDQNVYLTDNGMDHVEELLGMVLRDPNRPEEVTIEQERMMGYLNQALRAEFLYKRNKEYLVQSNKVIIIDSFTGRLMPGRRWSNGLHQAIEAKEGVKVEPENVTYATITLQNYYRMYQKIAGMTGTALTEKEEFYKIYLLDVIPIPTNLEYTAHLSGSNLVEKEAKDESGYKYIYYADPKRIDQPLFYKRKDYPDVIYQSEEAKFRAITIEILKNHVIGRPQLIGTASVEHSEYLASRLKQEPLRRLVQVLMLRRVWMEQNQIKDLESPIKEFIPFNKSILDINAGDLRPMARQLGVSLNIDEPENKPYLTKEFNLSETDMDRFLEVVTAGINPQVLNARKHDEEGMIIAHAGAYGAVTIATNMAGRGVDIKLGGELDEDILRDTNRVLSRLGIDPYNLTIEERYEAIKKIPVEEYGIYEESVKGYIDFVDHMKLVRSLGGLHVIGSERHESRRIDNQLRGRAARQGDPGSSRFYLSLQDEIVRLFGGQQLENVLKRVNLIDENVPLENSLFSRMIEQAQERVEGTNFDIRKHTLEYDDVLNTQRKRIYDQRDQAFIKADLSEDIYALLETDLKNHLEKSKEEEKWKLAAYLDSVQPAIELEGIFLPSFSQKMIIQSLQKIVGSQPSREHLLASLIDFGKKAFEVENRNGMEIMEKLIENNRTSFETQLSERQNNFELFVDSLKDKLKQKRENEESNQLTDPLRPQDVLADASSYAKVAFRLNPEKQRLLAEGDESVLDELRDQITSALFNVFVQRLNLVIGNRLSGDYSAPAETIAIGDWDSLSSSVMHAVEKAYTLRADKLFGSQAQIQSDLTEALKSYQPSDLTDLQWVQLLRTMSQGQHIAFDAKTHRKSTKTYTRCSFIYYCGQLLENLEADELQRLIWEHYMDAMKGQRMIFGWLDWSRIRTNNLTLSQMKTDIQARIRQELGEDTFAEIKDVSPMEINGEPQLAIQSILGQRLQNEVHRQVLLRSITSQWVDYLTQIEGLRVSISMESYAQRNPLVVYKMKAAELFTQLLNDIRQNVVERMFIALPALSMLTVSERIPVAADNAENKESPQQQKTNAEKSDREKKEADSRKNEKKQKRK